MYVLKLEIFWYLYAHQGYKKLFKKKSNIVKWKMSSCDGKAEVLAVITPVFRVL